VTFRIACAKGDDLRRRRSYQGEKQKYCGWYFEEVQNNLQ
jgi:hypothetical protein